MDPRNDGRVSCYFIGKHFFGLQILDVKFCNVVGGASCVLGVGWKSTFGELFTFALGGPTAPTEVERRRFDSLAPRSGKADEVGLGLG